MKGLKTPISQVAQRTGRIVEVSKSLASCDKVEVLAAFCFSPSACNFC